MGTPMTPRLLASSTTVAGIERLINRFWMSDQYRVDPTTLAITHASGRPVPTGAAVEHRRGRYRFLYT